MELGGHSHGRSEKSLDQFYCHSFQTFTIKADNFDDSNLNRSRDEIPIRIALDAIPNFDGESSVSVDQYINGCKKARRMLRSRSEDQLLIVFQSKVSGKASDVIDNRSFDSLQSYYSHLVEIFSEYGSDLQVCGELYSIIQYDDESIHDYISRVKMLGMRFLEYHSRLMGGAIDDDQERNVESQITKCFVRGLKTMIRLGVKEEENFELASKQAIVEEKNVRQKYL